MSSLPPWLANTFIRRIWTAKPSRNELVQFTVVPANNKPLLHDVFETTATLPTPTHRSDNPVGHPNVNDSRLRILQVNSHFDGGGADSQTLELALALRELGHDVTLAISHDARWMPRLQELGLPFVTFPRKSFLRNEMIRDLVPAIRGKQIQIVHAHQGRDYWPAAIAARLGGARMVVTRHLMNQPKGFSRWFLLRAGEAIAVSKAVEAVLRDELSGPGRRIHQAYCGIDTNAFVPQRSAGAEQWRTKLGWQPEHVVFGVVGVYDLPVGKGQLEFIQAAASIRSEFPQARFVVIGKGSMESLLRERCAALKVQDVLTFVPFTDDNVALMNALDVLVHPAVGADAFPLVVLEGMACGKPVIASSIDGIVEQFKDGEQGFFISRGDVPALASAMARMLREPELRQRMGKAGRQHACSHYTRERLGRNVAAIYEKVLHER